MTADRPGDQTRPTEADRLAAVEAALADLRPLAAELPALKRQVAELRAARPKAWNTPADLSARLGRHPNWWREACSLGLIPGAVKDADSGKWRVPVAAVEGFEAAGTLPVLPPKVRAGQPGNTRATAAARS